MCIHCINLNIIKFKHKLRFEGIKLLLRFSSTLQALIHHVRVQASSYTVQLGSPLKDSIARIAWKSKSNWERLAGTNRGGFEGLVFSSPRNPYSKCIHTASRGQRMELHTILYKCTLSQSQKVTHAWLSQLETSGRWQNKQTEGKRHV